jgi:predicted dithiol-disulfide oxidoreductase (DUF899 family)
MLYGKLSNESEPYQKARASAIMEENEYRGLDLYTPVWNFLDLTPDGRGDWFPGVQGREGHN